MRLIDADILIEKLKSYAECDWNKSLCTMLPNVVDDCIEFVEEQATAYSVDTVVEELDTARTNNNGLKFELIPFDKVAEIVKHGVSGTETETIRDKAVKWNNNSSKRVPYEFIDYVEGKRDIGSKPKPSRS